VGLTFHRRFHLTHRQDRTVRRDPCSVCGTEANVVVIERDGLPEPLRIALCESHGGSLLEAWR
jgi:hypothetical protein